MFNIGCADGFSVWENGDIIAFIGTDRSGSMSVYILKHFGVNKVSDTGFDALISQAITDDGYRGIGSGVAAHGHQYYLLTFYSPSTNIIPEATYVLDLETGVWGQWKTDLPGYSAFEVMALTIRAGQQARPVVGITVAGDLFQTRSGFDVQDTIGELKYVDDGYIDPGYVSNVSGVGQSFMLKIRTGQFDGKTNQYKFATDIKARMSATVNSQTMTITAYDNNESNGQIIGTLDTSEQEDNIIGGGRFLRRNHEILYS